MLGNFFCRISNETDHTNFCSKTMNINKGYKNCDEVRLRQHCFTSGKDGKGLISVANTVC